MFERNKGMSWVDSSDGLEYGQNLLLRASTASKRVASFAGGKVK